MTPRPIYVTPPHTGRGWGFNNWLYGKCAHLIRDGHSPEAVLEALLANHAVTALAKPGECERQVASAKASLDNTDYKPRPKVSFDHTLAYPIIKHAGDALEKLTASSPSPDPSPEEVIDALFPDDSWVCCGVDRTTSAGATTYKALCYKKPFWMEGNRLANMAYLVPNPMKGKEGTNRLGAPSTRCLDNIKERRFVVFEGDTISKHEQAAVILYLSKYAKLAAVADSGKKSLHAYFFTENEGEETVNKFFDLAVRLGADPVHRNPCQFARMPGGKRDNETRQRILFFNPSYQTQ